MWNSERDTFQVQAKTQQSISIIFEYLKIKKNIICSGLRAQFCHIYLIYQRYWYKSG